MSNTLMDGREPFDYEAVTVSDSATGMTSAKSDLADEVFITFEGATRWRMDGTSPTSSEGHLTANGDVLTLRGRGQIDNFEVIATGSDVDIRVTYLR